MAGSTEGYGGPIQSRGGDPAPGQKDDARPVSPRRVHETETVIGGHDDASLSSGVTPSAESAHTAADADEFKRVLIELGLISAGELGAFEVDPSLGVLGLARALVKAGRLTPYQSAAIYQKKSRGLLVGKYLILDKLGQGGMGVVFKAKQRTTGKVVALKILPPSFARDHQAVARFKREIAAAGRLSHPNIVAALDADEDRGVHFLVMDYVEGRDLDRVVRANGPMAVGPAIDCLIQAARGLEAAHAQGIVHRDIKPGNLMLDATGNVRVLDLGLARIVEAANPFGATTSNRLTQSGMYMGTIDYMAPEQAEDSRRADHRADIYSLGCTLYYLLTGHEPFPAETVLKRLMAHQERPAPKLRAARPDAPPALELTFQQMMAKKPAERPATMTELVALLERCKAAITEGQAASVQAPKSRPELKVFDEPLQRARPAKTEAEPSLVTMRDQADAPTINDDLRLEDLAIDVRSEPPALSMLPSRRSAVTRPKQNRSAVAGAIGAIVLVSVFVAAFALRSGPGKPRPEGPSEPTNRVTQTGGSVRPVDESGKERITSESSEAGTGRQGDHPQGDSLTSRSAPTLTTKPTTPATLPEPYVETARYNAARNGWLVEMVRLLPDRKTLVTAGQDNSARLWDLKTGREIRQLWHPAGIRAAVVLPDGQRAVTGCTDGFIRLWDLQTGRQIRHLVKHEGPALSVAVSPDGGFIVSGGTEPFLRVSNVETGGEVRQIQNQSSGLWSLAISDDGQRVLSGGFDGIVRVGNLKSADPLWPLEQHSGQVFGVAFAPDGAHAVSSCIGQLIFWDLITKKSARQINIDNRQLAAIALADGHRVVFCSHLKREDSGVSNDGLIGTWDFESDEEPRIIYRGPPGHLSLALLPDGGIVTGDVEGFARIWEPSASIARARELVAAGKKVEALAEYDEAIAQRPDDARLKIERGRLMTELGRTSEADADFTRAAQLAADNPQLFVDAGWWVAGPYPPKFDLAIDSDRMTDPSKPLPPSGNEPRHWKRAPTKSSGLVDMASEFASFGKNVTGYAMTVVYSAKQRQAVLLIGADDLGQVWFDGLQILDTKSYTGPGANGIEVTLKKGRNVIVARVVNTAGDHNFHLRIGDKPADFLFAHFTRELWSEAAGDYLRAMAEEPSNLDSSFHHRGAVSLARLGRLKDAITAYRRSIELNPAFIGNWHDLVRCELAADDDKSYQGTCREMVEQFGGAKNPYDVNLAAWATALAPGAVTDYAKVLSLMQPLINSKNPPWNHLNTYGSILYRKGDYQVAINYLRRSIDAEKTHNTAFEWVFIAMARHQLRQSGDKHALQTAKKIAERTAFNWDSRIEIDHLLKEATRELDLPPVR